MSDIQGQRITALTAETAPTTGDKFLLDSSTDGARQIDYDALATAILNKLTTKTYTLDAGTKTLIAALNELNSKIGVTIKRIEIAGVKTLSVASGYRGIMAITDSTSTRNGLYFLYSTAGGSVKTRTISEASDVSIDVSVTNELTITPTSGTRCVMFVTLNETIS